MAEVDPDMLSKIGEAEEFIQIAMDWCNKMCPSINKNQGTPQPLKTQAQAYQPQVTYHGPPRILGDTQQLDPQNCNNYIQKSQAKPQLYKTQGANSSDEEWYKEHWLRIKGEVWENLEAKLKSNELSDAVIRAKLDNKMNCYNEFEPMVDKFYKSISDAFDQCVKFVPEGQYEELVQCCNNMTQPLLSDIESKLQYLNECVKQNGPTPGPALTKSAPGEGRYQPHVPYHGQPGIIDGTQHLDQQNCNTYSQHQPQVPYHGQPRILNVTQQLDPQNCNTYSQDGAIPAPALTRSAPGKSYPPGGYTSARDCIISAQKKSAYID